MNLENYKQRIKLIDIIPCAIVRDACMLEEIKGEANMFQLYAQQEQEAIDNFFGPESLQAAMYKELVEKCIGRVGRKFLIDADWFDAWFDADLFDAWFDEKKTNKKGGIFKK